MGRHYDQGVALFHLKRFREATDVFTKDIQEQPGFALSMAMRAACWLNLSKNRNANDDIREALRLDPNIGYSHYILSCVLTNQGRSKQAEAAAREAIRLEKRAVYFCRLAEIYFFQGSYDRAITTVEEGLTIDPSHTSCLRMRSKCLAGLGRTLEAKECLLALLSQSPEDPDAHLALGKLKLGVGATAEARDSLQEARRLNPIDNNDRDALAAAYGRMQWPLRVIDRNLVRINSWTPLRRWLLIAAASTLLILVAYFSPPHTWSMLPFYLVLFNGLMLLATLDLLAIPLGKVGFRRDLDIRWFELLLETIRVIAAVLFHGVATAAAIFCAYEPGVAIGLFAIAPNVELVLLLARAPKLSDQILIAVGLVFLVGIPMCLAIVFMVDQHAIVPAMVFWVVSLLFSFGYTLRR